VASKVVLRWDVVSSPSLPTDVKRRLQAQQKNRIALSGELVLSSQRFRDQDKNRRDVLDRLGEIIRLASIPPKPRKLTRPTRASKERRLTAKKHRAQTKSARRPSLDL
jgi:ribosome-associated protein